MKHSIINEFSTCTKVLSIIEDGKDVLIEIETFLNVDGKSINSQEFVINKEKLHSFIGTLLHVQAKMKGGNNG